MSNSNSNTSRSRNLEIIQKLCESGLHHYTNIINQAHIKGDWPTLREISMKFEKDCYNIGEVELAGKLILLRLHLQNEHVDRSLVEQTLKNIFDLASNLQHFMIKHLENSNFQIDENNLHYITMIKNQEETCELSWGFNICRLQ